MSKRKLYGAENLRAAVGSVKSRKLTVTQASREFGIPRQTVADHVKENVTTFKKPGINPSLSVTEESALVDYLKYMGERGFPLNRQHLRSYVMEIIKRSGRQSLFNVEKGPSDKWIRKFLSRHQELTEKTPQLRDRGRTRMSNQTVIDKFFKTYDKTLEKLKLKTKPSQIFNCDETGFSDKKGTARKFIGEKGRPCIQQQVHTVDHVTAHLCISGDGKILPSFIIYQKSLPHRPYREDIPRTWMFGVSESGYMDTDLFSNWFRNIFVRHCGRERPVLLLLDNHDSHISIPVIELARQEEIEILAFPAHTTHLLQPLDVNVFGPLKEKMKSLANSLALANSIICVNKANLPTLLSYGIDQTCSPALVKASFRKSGLIPCNPQAIDKSQLLPADFKKNTNADESNSTTSESDSVNKDLEKNICSSCGKSSLPHPIETVRNLPPVLQSIFVTPNIQEKPKNRRIVLEARIITGDDMLNQLKQKETDEKEKNEAKEKRKQERENKKRGKENTCTNSKRNNSKKSNCKN